ncbi:MAG: hypothetical protein J5517_00955 [Eubacterium sp.]|nr:hypothetical protein [Eubacterium sp.]
MILTLVFFVTSCGANADVEQGASITDNVSMKAGTVQLFHATDSAVEPDSERYQLKQPDNLSASLDEVIDAMTLDEGITIEKYTIETSKTVTLYVRYADGVTEEKKLLSNAAIVKSLGGLEISTVQVTTLGEGDEEVDMATYTDSSFYYYEE